MVSQAAKQLGLCCNNIFS